MDFENVRLVRTNPLRLSTNQIPANWIANTLALLARAIGHRSSRLIPDLARYGVVRCRPTAESGDEAIDPVYDDTEARSQALSIHVHECVTVFSHGQS